MTAQPVAAARTIYARRRKSKTRFLSSATIAERRIERRVALAWGLLFFNIMSYDRGSSALPIPNSIGKVVTQLALPVAILVALTVNRRAAIRPNVYLCLVSLLAFEAVFTALGAEYPRGTLFRTARLVGFVIALWLLTPYWGRDRMVLVRYHVKVLFGLVCLSLVGLVVSHHKALGSGRFIGTIWPIPATQLAHYAAVAIGMLVILWFGGHVRGRTAAIMIIISFLVLLLTHTRTALLAAIAGLAVGLITWLPTSARVREVLGITVGVALVVYVTAASVITAWLARGQSAQQLSNLTGRTNFWGPLLAFPRTRFEMVFGFGISNGTFSGLPIDSNWLDSYQDQGIFGIVVCALILLFLLIATFFQARGMYRALALFLVVYCLLASFTEDGITNASSYMLDVTVAASLLVPTSVLTFSPRRLRQLGRAEVSSGSPPPLG